MAVATIVVEDAEDGFDVKVRLNLEAEEIGFNDMELSQRMVYALSEILKVTGKPDLIMYAAEALKTGNIIQFSGIVEAIQKGGNADVGVDSMTLNQLRDFCHNEAVKNGWWNDPETGKRIKGNKGELIAGMHEELSECLKGVRTGVMDSHLPHRKAEEVELADAIMRIMSYAGEYSLDLQGAVREKVEYNKDRDDHKPEVRAGEGGKKF
jgi:NTP pyrophosphatase (non-canonical NTP hydrolase)